MCQSHTELQKIDEKYFKAKWSSEATAGKGFLGSTGQADGLWTAFTHPCFTITTGGSVLFIHIFWWIFAKLGIAGVQPCIWFSGISGGSTAPPEAYTPGSIILNLRQLDWTSHPLVCSTIFIWHPRSRTVLYQAYREQGRWGGRGFRSRAHFPAENKMRESMSTLVYASD